jgi:hypothetical protein
MGIGFVLFGFLFVSLVIALIIGITRAVKTQQENAELSESFRKSPIKQFLIPVGIAMGLFLAIIGYMIWCEVVLGEDPGFGDAWQVQLSNNYSFVMIDTTEEGFIEEPNGHQPVYGVRKIGQDGNFLFGEAQGNYFVVDTSSKQIWTLSSKQALQDQCATLGIKSNTLFTPDEFYNRNRKWFLSLLPFIIIGAILWFVIRRRSGRNAAEPTTA